MEAYLSLPGLLPCVLSDGIPVESHGPGYLHREMASVVSEKEGSL